MDANQRFVLDHPYWGRSESLDVVPRCLPWGTHFRVVYKKGLREGMTLGRGATKAEAWAQAAATVRDSDDQMRRHAQI